MIKDCFQYADNKFIEIREIENNNDTKWLISLLFSHHIQFFLITVCIECMHANVCKTSYIIHICECIHFFLFYDIIKRSEREKEVIGKKE